MKTYEFKQTPFKDKHNKDIYEGDIIAIEDIQGTVLSDDNGSWGVVAPSPFFKTKYDLKNGEGIVIESPARNKMLLNELLSMIPVDYTPNHKIENLPDMLSVLLADSAELANLTDGLNF